MAEQNGQWILITKEYYAMRACLGRVKSEVLYVFSEIKIKEKYWLHTLVKIVINFNVWNFKWQNFRATLQWSAIFTRQKTNGWSDLIPITHSIFNNSIFQHTTDITQGWKSSAISNLVVSGYSFSRDELNFLNTNFGNEKGIETFTSSSCTNFFLKKH